MITTISAFMVKTTPIEALKVRNMLTSTPPAATSAPPSANANAEARRTSIATSCGGHRIDRDRANRGAAAGARQREIDRAADHGGEQQRDQPVDRDRAAEHRERDRQIGIAEILAAEDVTSAMPWTTNSRPKVARMLSTSSIPWFLARRTSGTSSTLVDQPVEREGERHDDDEPDERAHRQCR